MIIEGAIQYCINIRDTNWSLQSIAYLTVGKAALDDKKGDYPYRFLINMN